MGLNLKANVLASGISDPVAPLEARLAAVNLLRASEATVTASADEAGGEKENAYEQGFTFDFWRTGGSGTHWLRSSFTAGVITGETLDVSSEVKGELGDDALADISISSDGLHLYVIDIRGSDRIYAYTLSVPFDLTSGVYDGAGSDLDVSSQDGTMLGLSVSSDGLKLFTVGQGNKKVFSYSLAIAHNLSTASYDGASFDLDVSGQDTAPRGVALSSDGLHVYVVGITNTKVYAYTLTTANDLRTATYDGAGDDLGVSGQDTAPEGLAINEDGTLLFVVGRTNDKVYSFQFGAAFNLGTATYRGSSTDLDVSGEETGPRGVTVSPDATKLYVAGTTTVTVYAYTIAVASNYMGIAAHDLHNHGATVKAQYGRALSLLVSAEDIDPQGLSISSDGLHLFVIGLTNTKVYAYTLGVSYDLTTAVYDGSGDDLDVSGQDATPRGLAISSDGLHLFVLGDANNKVYAYTLSVAHDLGTATYDGAPDDLSVGAQDADPTGVAVSSDGLHMYVVGLANGKVYAYTFGVAFDGSSLTYDGAGDDLSVAAQDNLPRDLAISSDGLHLYVVGTQNDSAYAYTLSVAHDLGTATYDGAGFDLDVSGETGNVTGVSISSDGLHLFTCGNTSDRVFAYSLTPAHDLSTAEHLTWLDSSETFTPRTSAPILMLFDDVVALNHRLLIVVTSEPSIGAVHLGCALKLDSVLPGDYGPPTLALGDKHLVERSESGFFLGRSIVAARTGINVEIVGVDLPWLRSRWEAHVRLIEQFPFFWSSGDQPLIDGIAEGGTFYGWVTEQPQSRYAKTTYGSLTLRAGGIVS